MWVYQRALSGEPVGEVCQQSVKDLYIKHKSFAKKCTFHRKIAIDTETELALDEQAKQAREYTEEVFIVWPDKLQSWAKQYDPDYLMPPEYMVASKRVVSFDKNRPRILSPLHKCEYFTFNIGKTVQKLALLANASFDADKLYWFINDAFYATSDVGEKLFWTMQEGRHKITCVDKHGRSSFIRIVVR